MSVMGHDEGMAAASEAFRQARQEVEYFGASEDFTRNPLEAAVEAYLDATNLRGAVEQNERLKRVVSVFQDDNQRARRDEKGKL